MAVTRWPVLKWWPLLCSFPETGRTWWRNTVFTDWWRRTTPLSRQRKKVVAHLRTTKKLGGIFWGQLSGGRKLSLNSARPFEQHWKCQIRGQPSLKLSKLLSCLSTPTHSDKSLNIHSKYEKQLLMCLRLDSSCVLGVGNVFVCRILNEGIDP